MVARLSEVSAQDVDHRLGAGGRRAGKPSEGVHGPDPDGCLVMSEEFDGASEAFFFNSVAFLGELLLVVPATVVVQPQRDRRPGQSGNQRAGLDGEVAAGRTRARS